MEEICRGAADPADIRLFTLREHQSFEQPFQDYISSLNLDFKETDYEGVPQYLGITPDLCASYYIGADWLTPEHGVVVLPKMERLDYITMFMDALEFAPSAEYFNKFYGINFCAPQIECGALNSILTPLIALQFLTAVKHLIHRGIKRGYVHKEENLKGKIKGKICISQHFSKNISNMRQDRIYCSYKEFIPDIPENRLIKRALIFTKQMFSSLPGFSKHSMSRSVWKMLNDSMTAFQDVSDDSGGYSHIAAHRNKLYRHYEAPLKLARQILRRYDYSLHKLRNEPNLVPPFWIDMSRLYEVFIYSKLRQQYDGIIKFQVAGNYRTAADFVLPQKKLIIDTKYKPGAGVNIDDIRQISGYARDEKILREINPSDIDFIPDCLLIYPEEEEKLQGSSTIEDCQICNNWSKVSGFHRFFKICVPLPQL